MERLQISDGDFADIYTALAGATDRRLSSLRVVQYDIPTGSCATYFPECNDLFPLSHHDPASKTPAYKSLPVRIRKTLVPN